MTHHRINDPFSVLRLPCCKSEDDAAAADDDHGPDHDDDGDSDDWLKKVILRPLFQWVLSALSWG